MSYSNGLFNFGSGQQVIKGEKVEPGVGLKLKLIEITTYIDGKKLTDVAERTVSNDAITKHQLDTAMIDKHDNNQDIDLKDTYSVINSKPQSFNEMNTNRKTLVCYEDVRDVFVSRKESVFPMETHLDMGNNYI